MRLLRMQIHQPMQQERASGGMTPQASNMVNQVRMNFLNPGGGRIGNDNSGDPFMAQYGFGGYYRGSPMDSYEGVPSNVGNISLMRGDAPAMNTPGSVALARLSGTTARRGLPRTGYRT